MRRDDVGALLCRHTERVQLLEAELGGRMPALPGQIASTWPTLRVAVNDDSVATWFIDAVGPFCTERETLLDLVIDDWDYTASRIRDGSVQGAVTAQAEPIQGCRSERLGRIRYRAVCSPAFYARYFDAGITRDALRRAPCVMFNPKDGLQARFIRRVTRADLDPPQHWIPHVAGYLRACETGLGWGCVRTGWSTANWRRVNWSTCRAGERSTSTFTGRAGVCRSAGSTISARR